jgi:hypothetical protein
MTTEQKQKLFDRLTRNLERMSNDPFARKLFEQSTLEDIEAIEPLVDIFIASAKIEALKELGEAIQKTLAAKGDANAVPEHTPST